MDLQDGLIHRIELFYDATPLQQLKKEIFAEESPISPSSAAN
jgi:hypothetical protein